MTMEDEIQKARIRFIIAGIRKNLDLLKDFNYPPKEMCGSKKDYFKEKRLEAVIASEFFEEVLVLLNVEEDVG